jgi:hypothetical protein
MHFLLPKSPYCIEFHALRSNVISRPVFTHGPQGPEPRAANFQGRHTEKKSRLKYGMRGEKGCPWERNLREICTENNVGNTALLFCILETHKNVLSFVSFFLTHN